MIFLLLEPADNLVDCESIVQKNGKPLTDSKLEHRYRLVASAAREGFIKDDFDIQIQKSLLWILCFFVVNPIHTDSRLGECIIGIRRTPLSWMQRKLRLFDSALVRSISSAGFVNDALVHGALDAISKGKVNANHSATR